MCLFETSVCVCVEVVGVSFGETKVYVCVLECKFSGNLAPQIHLGVESVFCVLTLVLFPLISHKWFKLIKCLLMS